MPHNTKSYILDVILKKKMFLILHMNTMSNALYFFLGNDGWEISCNRVCFYLRLSEHISKNIRVQRSHFWISLTTKLMN
jgi:hypothetical protein